ncbi:MAG: DUF4843 domain-containing protein [Prevotellaceae bacterium]|jgi:hypothetical protein|nr:DUF4843 domain-containing protein [Prevotellaceae bacterium]
MKKIFLYSGMLIVAIISINACNEVEYLYNSPAGIYFDFKDSVSSRQVYSFAYTPGMWEHTLYLPVKISGKRAKHARSFKVETVKPETTAENTVHYALPQQYIIAADSGTYRIPITLFNTDPRMDDSTFVLSLRLLPSDEFHVDFPHKITAQVSFSNRLEKPVWWDYDSWRSSLGDYSRTKHQLFLISSGTIDLSDPQTESEKTMQSLNYIIKFKTFITDPLAWTAKHEDYAMDEIAPGSMYQFYEKAKPDKRYTCIRMNMGPLGFKFGFLDENGGMIQY